MTRPTRPIVGIDLGTTNSAVAYINNGKPEIIPSPHGQRIIPSVVMIGLDGKVHVGDTARAAQIAMPDRVVAAVKRKMGSTEPVTMAGQAFLPQEISAMILREIKSYVDAKFGPGEKEAVITVPAYFTDEQRRATKQAGELAGFIVERIINEPTAAAMAFGLERLEEDKHILVYDLGGGTFDVSIVEMMSGILEVKASAGNNHLGGEDFDWRLVGWLADKIRKAHGVDPLKDLRAKSLLKEQAERIKKELSTAPQVEIHLPLVTMKDDRPVGLSTTITRREFVALIDGQFYHMRRRARPDELPKRLTNRRKPPRRKGPRASLSSRFATRRRGAILLITCGRNTRIFMPTPISLLPSDWSIWRWLPTRTMRNSSSCRSACSF